MGLSNYDLAHLEDLIAGEGDWFSAKLVRLIKKADRSNRDLLRKGFPKEVMAVELWEMGRDPRIAYEVVE